MTPGDITLMFNGWIDAHSPPKPGSRAMSRGEYEALKEACNGGNNSL
jgi:hypothetical protein